MQKLHLLCFGVLGIFIKGTDPDSMKSVNAPKRLMKIKGGHTGVDLVNYLIGAIAEHSDVRNSAFNTIHSKL